MSRFTAIDPGIITGLAWFVDGRLVRAALHRDGQPSPELFADVLIEVPEYQRGRRVNPNDLITLALRVGRIQGRVLAAGGTVELVTPSSWKGNVPKRIHNARTLARLTPEERVIVPANARHDVIDAIGIGLWRLGR